MVSAPQELSQSPFVCDIIERNNNGWTACRVSSIHPDAPPGRWEKSRDFIKVNKNP